MRMDPALDRRDFVIAIAAMGLVVLASNILVQSPFTYGGLGDYLTWGAFSYPFAFLVTDLSNRRFGPRTARRIVYAGFLLAVLLFGLNHWIGVDEPKAVLSAPLPASLAERAGMRSGDWVRAVSRDGVEWVELRSLNDLRWQITQATLDGVALQLDLSDAQGRAPRSVRRSTGFRSEPATSRS